MLVGGVFFIIVGFGWIGFSCVVFGICVVIGDKLLWVVLVVKVMKFEGMIGRGWLVLVFGLMSGFVIWSFIGKEVCIGVFVIMVVEIGVIKLVDIDFDCESVFLKFGEICCVDAIWKGVVVVIVIVGVGCMCGVTFMMFFLIGLIGIWVIVVLSVFFVSVLFVLLLRDSLFFIFLIL